MDETKKSRRTAEEMKEAMEKADAEKMQQAEDAVKEIAAAEAEIKKLQKKIAEKKRVVTNNRNKARTSVGMSTYSKVVTALGFLEDEKKCKVKSEFVSLQAKILNRIKELKTIEEQYKKEGSNNDVLKPEEVAVINPVSDNLDQEEVTVANPVSDNSVPEEVVVINPEIVPDQVQ